MTNAKLVEVLRGAGVLVYHNEAARDAQLPYIVYNEVQRRARSADNRGILPVRKVSAVYYTADVDDGRVEQLCGILDDAGIPHTVSFRPDMEQGHTACDILCEVRGNA